MSFLPEVRRALRLILLILAIVDASGGITVVVVFHSDGARLAGAAAALLSVVAARRLGLRWPLVYVPLALVAWVCALEQLEHRLHPWSSITAFTALGLRPRVGRLPNGVYLGHVVGAGALAGIGFTVSLFVAGLAFDSPSLVADARIGILIASLLAGTLGTLLLVGVRHRQALTSSRWNAAVGLRSSRRAS